MGSMDSMDSMGMGMGMCMGMGVGVGVGMCIFTHAHVCIFARICEHIFVNQIQRVVVPGILTCSAEGVHLCVEGPAATFPWPFICTHTSSSSSSSSNISSAVGG